MRTKGKEQERSNFIECHCNGLVLDLSLVLEFSFEPYFPKEFNRMLRSNGPVPAPKIVNGTVLLTSPAVHSGCFG